MKDSISKLIDRGTDEAWKESSYRRLVKARLPMNLYSARAHLQRRAATLLHGMDKGSGLWEELDCFHLADDERGDRTSLLLGGATGGAALNNLNFRGAFSAAGTGTLFLAHVEKLGLAAQRVLCKIIQSGRFPPVGDPFPRPINCRIIVGTERPLIELARRLIVGWELAEALGRISLRAEDIVNLLDPQRIYSAHPSSLAAAS